jgi:phosphorylase/glycogen(starch) synthase
LTNAEKDRVKIIFVPSYLNGNDGIFNLSYWNTLIGFDLTIFPSYYEPWGYTPLESLAFRIPTITTTLAGFGVWIMNQVAEIDECIGVIERTDTNYNTVVEEIANKMIICSYKSEIEKERARENAYFISRTALWKNLIQYYHKAYQIALDKVETRTDRFIELEPVEPIAPIKISKVNKPVWRGIFVEPNLSGKFKGLDEISKNLWWSWDYEAEDLFRYIGKDLWEESQYNPVLVLKEVSYDRLVELEKDKIFIQKYESVYSRFKKYMKKATEKKSPKIAYFSMEYGLINTIRTYSGGLGILAGDYLKEASDSNIDLIGVGLLYKFGYFKQQLSLQGDQLVSYEPQVFANLPITPVRDKKGNKIVIQIAFPGRIVYAQIWKVNVGRIDLYLLDTNRKDNLEQDRFITHQLYGGDEENRLKQEILLGIGGIRALNILGIEQDLYHCNEGHAAFLGLERLHLLIKKYNFTFSESLEIIRASTLFTTHTPVPAGHDTFPEELIMTYLGHYPERLKISWLEFINLGKIHPGNKNERFSMSYLAANISQEINGVSKLHGEVTKIIFSKLWEGYYPEELHIGYVTNGVHCPTWTSKEWRILFQKECDADFLENQSNREIWNKISKISDKKIWEIRQKQKKRLIEYIKGRIDSYWVKRREDPRRIMKIKNRLDKNSLTIGFARRFATYKRGDLLFRDIDRLAKIVNNPGRPVQFIFAGKAHPKDLGGQKIIKQIMEISKQSEFLGKVIFLENYDISLAKELVAGVDVWLNTPVRPLEASGTSGMKAVMNGVLHFSVLDGWWVEGYKDAAGWALDQNKTYSNQEFQDELDSETIYRILENEIIPLYYDRDENNLPLGWISYIKNSLVNIAPEFTMKRMLDDYMEKYYKNLETRTIKLRKNEYELAKDIAAWKTKVFRNWDSLKITSLNFSEPIKKPLFLGEKYYGEVVLDLNGLSKDCIGIELVISELLPDGSTNIIETNELQLMKIEGRLAHYAIELIPPKPGSFNLGMRIFPKNEFLPHRQDLAM